MLSRFVQIFILLPLLLSGFLSGAPVNIPALPNEKIAIQLSSNGNSITLIDKTTQAPIITLPLETAYPSLVMTPDEKKVAVVNFVSNTVTIIDLNSLATSTVSVESSPTSIALVPGGTYAFVTNFKSSSLTQINFQTLETLTIAAPDGCTPSYIAIAPDGKTALVADNASDSVFVFNPITLTFEKQIHGFSIHQEGLFPEIAITPDGTTAWVTNTSSNTISSIIGLNTVSPTLGTSIQVENAPNKIVITPDGKFAYVSNTTSNNVSIITLSHAPSASEQEIAGQPIFSEELSAGIPYEIPSAQDLGFTGQRYKNKFAAQTEYVNKLFWQPSGDPTVVAYFLFRNGVLIAIIPASDPLKFIDHHRPKKIVDTYMLTSVNVFGVQSQTSIVTVP